MNDTVVLKMILTLLTHIFSILPPLKECMNTITFTNSSYSAVFGQFFQCCSLCCENDQIIRVCNGSDRPSGSPKSEQKTTSL